MAGGLGDMVQEVEHLPNKCKALSSNLSTIKKNVFGIVPYWETRGRKSEVSRIKVFILISHNRAPK
jgi:hypothetical protein